LKFWRPWYEEEGLGAGAGGFGAAGLEVGGEAGHDFGEVGVIDLNDLVRDGGEEPLKKFRAGGTRAGCCPARRNGFAAGILRGQGEEREGQHGEGAFLALADDEEVVAALPFEDDFGGAF